MKTAKTAGGKLENKTALSQTDLIWLSFQHWFWFKQEIKQRLNLDMGMCKIANCVLSLVFSWAAIYSDALLRQSYFCNEPLVFTWYTSPTSQVPSVLLKLIYYIYLFCTTEFRLCRKMADWLPPLIMKSTGLGHSVDNLTSYNVITRINIVGFSCSPASC